MIDKLQQLLFEYFGLKDEFDDLNEGIGACVSDDLYPVREVTAYLSIKVLSIDLLTKLQDLLKRFSGFSICLGLDHEYEEEDYAAHLRITASSIRGTK
ncbi:hypothetical protein [Oceaniferula spumae]|uniref:hypothetical protein n=1 Tax=Oceaniferula spumae TaxID=2979115 RepID=UPI003F4EA342